MSETKTRWSAEDRLTYMLQAEGPDEFPEGFYRSIARDMLNIKDTTEGEK